MTAFIDAFRDRMILLDWRLAALVGCTMEEVLFLDLSSLETLTKFEVLPLLRPLEYSRDILLDRGAILKLT
jgi:hypothetical protein